VSLKPTLGGGDYIVSFDFAADGELFPDDGGGLLNIGRGADPVDLAADYFVTSALLTMLDSSGNVLFSGDFIANGFIDEWLSDGFFVSPGVGAGFTEAVNKGIVLNVRISRRNRSVGTCHRV
jgi:uncharacterized phage infection (PIP) family protein YhgE